MALIQRDQGRYRPQTRMEGRPQEDTGRGRPSTRKERGLGGTLPCPHLHPGLGLWDWETVRVCCVGPQAVMFVMAATGDSYGFLVMVLECHVFLPHWKQVLA